MLPDFERADRIGEFWTYPESRAFAELLIDCEEDPDARGGAGRDAAGGATAHLRAPRRATTADRAEWGRPVKAAPSASTG